MFLPLGNENSMEWLGVAKVSVKFVRLRQEAIRGLSKS